MISRLKNLLNLNLDQGPYITGSYLTHLIESRYRIPIWQPNDIDLVCKSEDQLRSVNEILKSIDPNVRIDYTADTTYYYWNIDGVCIQGILHDISYVDRLNFADYTITAIVSDGENNISLTNTETDIANKILNRFNYKTFGNKAYHLKRYQKYLNRGYIDSNNYIFNEINKWYS